LSKSTRKCSFVREKKGGSGKKSSKKQKKIIPENDNFPSLFNFNQYLPLIPGKAKTSQVSNLSRNEPKIIDLNLGLGNTKINNIEFNYNIKDYLVQARFVPKNGDFMFMGTTFNELMNINAIETPKIIFVNNKNANLYMSDFQSLKPGAWIDDQIISKYFDLLQKRDKILTSFYNERLESYYLDPYFLPKLLNVDSLFLNPTDYTINFEYYNILTPTILDIFFSLPTLNTLDKIYVPINLGGSHWILAVIFVQLNKVTIYDSLFDGTDSHRNNLLRFSNYLFQWYLETDKMQHDLYVPDTNNIKQREIDEWEMEVYDGSIKQTNSFDCGVYVMMTADFLSDDLLSHAKVNFYFENTTEMKFFRIKIGYDLMRGELDYPEIWEM
jgi:hypothetical protein